MRILLVIVLLLSEHCISAGGGTACIGGTYYSSGGCFDCPRGSYCPGGSSSPAAYTCSAGTYNPFLRVDSLEGCLPCPGGTRSDGAATACILCPANTYSGSHQSVCTACPTGAFSSAGQAFCSPCPPGTSFSDGQCVSCQPGTYQPASGAAKCVFCSPGTYSNTSGATSCSLCPPATFSGFSGQTSCESCPGAGTSPSGASRCISSECKPGSYFNTSGEQCDVCPVGKYSLSSGTMGSCTACPPGTFVSSNQTGSATRSICTPCPAGQYNEVDLAFSCLLCPTGTYGTTLGASGKERCVSCPAGTYSNISGAGSESTCTNCPPGTYSLSGSSECTLLAQGSYSNLTGLNGPFGVLCPEGTYGGKRGASGVSDCVACPAGTYSSAAGASSRVTCQPCPLGTYSSFLGASSVASCTACPAGMYGNISGAASLMEGCKDCGAGKFNTIPGASRCELVPPGFYSNATALQSSLAATPCPSGTFGNRSGSTNQADCALCPVGTYGPSQGSADIAGCIACPLGTYNSAQGASYLSGCVACTVGTYASTVGSSFCSKCPPGTVSSSPGSQSLASCVPCSIGWMSLAGSSACTPCKRGEYGNQSGSSTCYPCPVGTISLDVASSNCTPCASGTFSNSSGSASCMLCPSGTYQPSTGSSACLDCSAAYAVLPRPLDTVYQEYDAEACGPFSATIPLDYGVIPVADVSRILSPDVQVSCADGTSLPSYLSSTVTDDRAHVLLRAVEIPAVPLDSQGQLGFVQKWQVTITIRVTHSCLASGIPWTGNLTIRVFQTPPRFAALSSAAAAGVYACPQFETSLLVSLGSCGHRVSLGAYAAFEVNETNYSKQVIVMSTAAGGYLSIFGSASGVSQFAVFGVATLLGTNVTSASGVNVRVVSVEDNTPAIVAAVTAYTACPYFEARFSGSAAKCGNTVFSAVLTDGSLLPTYLNLYADSSLVVVSGVLPSHIASLTIVGVAALNGGQSKNASVYKSLPVVITRRQGAMSTAAISTVWVVGGGGNTVGGNRTVSKGAEWKAVTVYYGVPFYFSGVLGGVDEACSSVGLWASAQPAGTTSEPLADWLRVASQTTDTGNSVGRLVISGVPPSSDVVGTIYTVCIYALDGTFNPCLCLELMVALSLTLTSSHLGTNNTTEASSVVVFQVSTPSPVLTAKGYLPLGLPSVVLLVCPDSGNSGSLGFCQFNALTGALSVFGTADGVGSILTNLRVASSAAGERTLNWLGSFNMTLQLSDSVNPSAVSVGIPLSSFSLYNSVRVLSSLVVLQCKIGIPAHISLSTLLSPASADAVTNVQFSLARDALRSSRYRTLESTFVVNGVLLEGTAAGPSGNRSVWITVLDTRTTLTTTVECVVIVATPLPPNATTSELTHIQLRSGDTTVAVVSRNIFQDPEGGDLTFTATYSDVHQPLPLWASFDGDSLQLSLLPTSDYVGEHLFFVTAISTWGEWKGNVSVGLHVTVDYSMRDLLKSLYDTFGYVASAFSAAVIIFAYRSIVWNTVMYGRRVRDVPEELVQAEHGKYYITMCSARDVSLVRVRRKVVGSTLRCSLLWFLLPRYLQVRLSENDCEFANEGSGGIYGASWLRRTVQWTAADGSSYLFLDDQELKKCFQRGELRQEDVFVVEIESSGFFCRGFILEAFDLPMSQVFESIKKAPHVVADSPDPRRDVDSDDPPVILHHDEEEFSSELQSDVNDVLLLDNDGTNEEDYCLDGLLPMCARRQPSRRYRGDSSVNPLVSL